MKCDFGLKRENIWQDGLSAFNYLKIKPLSIQFKIDARRLNSFYTFRENMIQAPDFDEFGGDDLVIGVEPLRADWIGLKE